MAYFRGKLARFYDLFRGKEKRGEDINLPSAVSLHLGLVYTKPHQHLLKYSFLVLSWPVCVIRMHDSLVCTKHSMEKPQVLETPLTGRKHMASDWRSGPGSFFQTYTNPPVPSRLAWHPSKMSLCFAAQGFTIIYHVTSFRFAV